MNAIILAAGNSIRMVKDGLITPKPLLPILGIPNIERTILMLKDFGIKNIIILCNNKYISNYLFLNEKYKCKIVSVDLNLNTLYSIRYVIDEFNDTFVIEGDVVLARNVFIKLECSFYYTIKYLYCEQDAWCPILNNGIIVDFKIGEFAEPCIFGISFWHHNDCELLKSTLKSLFIEENFNNPNIFWDDCISLILSKITIKTFEIAQTDACEMNTKKEYELANDMCVQYYHNCEKFLLESPTKACSNVNINFVHDLEECYRWQKRLNDYINNILRKNLNYIDEIMPVSVFTDGEHPFMVKNIDDDSYVAYFDIAENSDYILLRRLFVDEKLRGLGIGKEIIMRINLYAKLTNKELRVNVYDENAEKFYKSLGMSLYFKTYKF